MWLSPRSHFVGEGKRDAGRIEGRGQCKTYLSRGVEPSSTPSEDRKTLEETFWAAERGLEGQEREVGQCKRMNVAKSSSQVFWKFFKCSPLPTSEACGCVPPFAHHRIDLNASTRCLDPLGREPRTWATKGQVVYTSSAIDFSTGERVYATSMGVASACTFPSIWPSVLILWRRHRPMFTACPSCLRCSVTLYHSLSTRRM